jgi:hypothetical protein
MSWRRSSAWRPVLHADGDPLDEESVVAALHSVLHDNAAELPFALGDNLNVPPCEFRDHARKAATQASPVDRAWADFVAAFGCESCHDEGAIHDTAFRTMSGAGHQNFLGFIKTLVKATTPDHLRAALFAPWQYADDPPSMRWDPMDDRRYALRWTDPSKDKIRTVRGANRLAVEALPMMPVAPVGSRLETTGFRGHSRLDTFWTWPMWMVTVSLEPVRSLLGLAELQRDPLDRNTLARLGVAEVYRSQRVTTGKYRNFSPAKAI